jgi:hypothetical protein
MIQARGRLLVKDDSPRMMGVVIFVTAAVVELLSIGCLITLHVAEVVSEVGSHGDEQTNRKETVHNSPR